MIYPLLRRLLFHLDPERAHRLAFAALAPFGALPPLRSLLARSFRCRVVQPVAAFGLTFPNLLGLAAGYDKDGDAWPGLSAFGFGHVEVGTVTPEPQPGNPKPRVFRLPEQRSLVNRMGFPSRGASYVESRLRRRRPPGLVLGVNIGKQKATPLEEAAGDYELLVERFAPLADYLAVNISSPNTPGLRRLQERAFLESLLARVTARRDRLAGTIGRRVPLLVKLAPDLDDAQLDAALEALLATGVDGVIATNTTVARDGVPAPLAGEAGGLSGELLAERSTRMVAAISRRTAGRLPVVGVGGVAGPESARAKLDAGAVLVQVYTGLVYEGPGLVRRILDGLHEAAEPRLST